MTINTAVLYHRRLRRMTIRLAFAWVLVACVRECYPAGPASRPATRPAATSRPADMSLGVYRVTAYCPCRRCCGRFSDGVTASGKPAAGKLIAADPHWPFGTVLDVPGYGRAEVLDRGGAIRARRLDVFFSSHKEALAWGVRMLEVRLVSMPDASKLPPIERIEIYIDCPRLVVQSQPQRTQR